METSKSVGIYEVAAIERPTHEAALAGAVARLILPPTAIIANGRSSALIEAATKVPTGTEFEPQRTDWIVRRFRGDSCD